MKSWDLLLETVWVSINFDDYCWVFRVALALNRWIVRMHQGLAAYLFGIAICKTSASQTHRRIMHVGWMGVVVLVKCNHKN